MCHPPFQNHLSSPFQEAHYPTFRKPIIELPDGLPLTLQLSSLLKALPSTFSVNCKPTFHLAYYPLPGSIAPDFQEVYYPSLTFQLLLLKALPTNFQKTANHSIIWPLIYFQAAEYPRKPITRFTPSSCRC